MQCGRRLGKLGQPQKHCTTAPILCLSWASCCISQPLPHHHCPEGQPCLNGGQHAGQGLIVLPQVPDGGGLVVQHLAIGIGYLEGCRVAEAVRRSGGAWRRQCSGGGFRRDLEVAGRQLCIKEVWRH